MVRSNDAVSTLVKMAQPMTKSTSTNTVGYAVELHSEPKVPSSNDNPRTQFGFLVDGPRLSGYKPTPPGKQPLTSWVWRHGEPVTRIKDGRSLWLCRLCYEQPGSQGLELRSAKSTNRPRDHLVDRHRFNEKGEKLPEGSKKRKRGDGQQQDVLQLLQQQEKADKSILDRAGWQAAYLEWTIGDDVSLRKSTSERLRRLLTNQRPVLESIVPRSQDTTRRWVMQLFERTKPAIQRSLARSRSKITLSFDGWKSNNELDLLGVLAHYVDEHLKLKTVMLGLKNLWGHHTGENMKHQLLDVIREYKISNSLGFFMADSANTNDAAIRLLGNDIDVDLYRQRVRCSAHVLNRVCNAILYGADVDCIDGALQEVATNNDDDGEQLEDDRRIAAFARVQGTHDEIARLKAWRKKGPIGKLHNIVIHARWSPARRELFKAKQRDTKPDERIFELVINGGVRWNSDHDMIERAWKLRDALELYQQHFKDDLADDYLANDDWLELKEIMDLLAPVKRASKVVQSNGDFYGSLWQTMTSMEWLLAELEEKKAMHESRPNTHLKACINLGWKKLAKYYSLTDRTPVYIASVALHPHFKMRWFEKHWQGLTFEARKGKSKAASKELWTDRARKVMQELYNEYKRRHAEEATPPRQTTTDRISTEPDGYEKSLWMDEEAIDDDLDRFLAEPPAPPKTNVLHWWQGNHERFPVLRHLAFDLIACPSSSSAAERRFSEAGNAIDENQWHTRQELAEAKQCLKSWYGQHLIPTDVIVSTVDQDEL